MKKLDRVCEVAPRTPFAQPDEVGDDRAREDEQDPRVVEGPEVGGPVGGQWQEERREQPVSMHPAVAAGGQAVRTTDV